MGNVLNKSKGRERRQNRINETGFIRSWGDASFFIVANRDDVLYSALLLLQFDLINEKHQTAVDALRKSLGHLASVRLRCRKKRPLPYKMIYDYLYGDLFDDPERDFVEYLEIVNLLHHVELKHGIGELPRP